MPEPQIRSSSRRGRLVTTAGFALNAAMGVLFAWSVIGKALAAPVASGGFGWSQTAAALPYTLALAMFGLIMIPAGRLQDRFGPRAVAAAGAILCGCGLFVAGRGRPDSAWPIVLGFGLLSGTGIGFGYASATPAAVKWFGPEKKGLITGIVISGFGLAPVFIAPLAQRLIDTRGISRTFDLLGILFVVVAGLSAALLVNPPGWADRPVAPSALRALGARLRNPGYLSLYVQMACVATAGLMIIGHIARIAEIQSGGAVRGGFILVAVLAAFNALGRVSAGGVSDLIGRPRVMIAVFAAQAVLMFFFDHFQTLAGLIFAAALVGFNYGSSLSLFPATVADRWGVENMGINYGLMFTAWGAGGVVGPILAGRIADATGRYAAAFRVSSGLLLLAVLLATLGYGRLSSRRQ